MFESLLVNIEAFSFHREKAHSLISEDKTFFVIKEPINGELWKWKTLEVPVTSNILEYQNSQPGFNSWVKARDQAIKVLSKEYKEMKFNPKMKFVFDPEYHKQPLEYDVIGQNFDLNFAVSNYPDKGWAVSISAESMFSEQLLHDILITKFKTRRQLLQKLHNRVAYNLDQLYQHDKHIYTKNRNLLLQNKNCTFFPWWSGFVKFEIDLNTIF